MAESKKCAARAELTGDSLFRFAYNCRSRNVPLAQRHAEIGSSRGDFIAWPERPATAPQMRPVQPRTCPQPSFPPPTTIISCSVVVSPEKKRRCWCRMCNTHRCTLRMQSNRRDDSRPQIGLSTPVKRKCRTDHEARQSCATESR